MKNIINDGDGMTDGEWSEYLYDQMVNGILDCDKRD